MIYMYLKIFVLLYADDTVILSESSDDLQIALNMYAAYCKEWKLEINNDKTKVMVFTKERNINYTFTINGVWLEVVSEYKYLGYYLAEVFRSQQRSYILQIRLLEQCLVF